MGGDHFYCSSGQMPKWMGQEGLGGLSWTIKVPSADMRHVAKEGCLHAACAELVHP